MAEAGFATGTPVNVRVMNGSLVLTAEVPPPEPEVIQTLRQLCPKLSARKQRELMDVIQVMAKPQKRGAG
ncbi:SymE family type I addiction module toxin [Erwinia rhapontici]|nr:SymE family type I addiction module toxin [Erwinia rhapontici]